MKTVILGIVMTLLGTFTLNAGPVVQVCNGNGSVDVKFSVEYNKPYWTVGRGRSTTNRIFRYETTTRRIIPIRGPWEMELKNTTPRRLVDKKGKVILEYRNGHIYKPGNSRAIASYRNNALFKGSRCIANFRNGKLPEGLVLAIAAQYYLAKDLNFTPIKFSTPVMKSQAVNLQILSLPFNKQAVTKYIHKGKVIYTFRNGFIYDGNALGDNTPMAHYAVSLGQFASVGPKKVKTPYIIHFFDLKNKTFVPSYTAQNIVRYALFEGKSVTENPLLHLGAGGKIYVGSQKKYAVGCISKDGSKLYMGPKAEGTPVLRIVGNRRNYWVDWFVWNKVLEKEIQDYLKANPDAGKPFPAQVKRK